MFARRMTDYRFLVGGSKVRSPVTGHKEGPHPDVDTAQWLKGDEVLYASEGASSSKMNFQIDAASKPPTRGPKM